MLWLYFVAKAKIKKKKKATDICKKKTRHCGETIKLYTSI
ncbi:hypothetical protein X975_18125, partial [Stegodyphus mimosarum]